MESGIFQLNVDGNERVKRREGGGGLGGKPGSFNWCLLQRRVNRDKACRCLKLGGDEGM